MKRVSVIVIAMLLCLALQLLLLMYKWICGKAVPLKKLSEAASCGWDVNVYSLGHAE